VPLPVTTEPARPERVPLGVPAMYYEIRGRVLQETDRAPLAGLRVEAWDADFLADDFLGSAITVASTRGDVMWNIKDPMVEVELLVDVGELAAGWVERNIYLKIERIENYSTARPQDKVVPAGPVRARLPPRRGT
jgi:hypothetical protein